MKTTTLLLFMLLAAATGQAQNKPTAIGIPYTLTQTISGKVVDESGKALPGVTIKFVSVKDTIVQATDAAGTFAFKNIKPSPFTLSFSYVGFIKQVKSYPAQLTTKEIKLGSIILQPSNADLKEVVVKVDTDQYNASPYHVNADPAAVDELLKKLKGMEVGADGTVTHQGQQVTKVRLNGKAYTGGNTQQSTTNLPATVIEKAQIIDTYGDQASRTGVKGYTQIQIRGAAPGTESYAPIVENKFINPLESPLSTFSVDVDAASYSNMRRFIQGGQLPPKDAIRIEEMINYFKYQYNEPKAGEPVTIQTDLAIAPWNPKHQLLRIGLKARTIPAESLPASNLVFLIDVSGSMNMPNKLPLVKTSMKMLVDQLRKKDRVAIVVYAGNAGLVLPATSGDEKAKIDEAIDNLQAGGSTAGGEGIILAYKIARENFMKGGNNRIVMATDGDFNVGASSDKSMEELITEERESKVDLSIMGFGMGNYKDSKMETLADKGNGNYAYIDNLTEAHKALVNEFGGTMFTVAKDVKLQIEFNPAKVQAYRLIGYENRLMAKEDFNNDKKDAGDMGSGHTVTAFYEIVPAGIKDDYAGSVDPLKYQKNETKPVKSTSNELVTVKFRYKQPGGDVSKLSQAVVMNKPETFDKLSVDFRFAAAVAEVGMLLRNSEFKDKASFNQAIGIARAARGDDQEGYRAEFVRLAETAGAMMHSELATSPQPLSR
ncbi:secreted protein with Ig-like and vWFA domain [Mucilaginibacter yixingensis]|uniref:Secreted protein with Ig-like and vWFA domain n=1 Tax=Mucilaginibacter yixingensis TaxID=1295612 RepID=A0A2T5J882_9SPHI|nr:von Willebrand factor type A domain-containing protein [Mucilaginibacter yixingensis]PTQ95666.1 secreted protein with Ig-like and vWFA domain [Mucilaginibacter yixingensis]